LSSRLRIRSNTNSEIIYQTVPGSLTLKATPKSTRKKKNKQKETSLDEENYEVKIEMVTPTSVIRNTNLEPMDIELQTPSNDDGQHFIIDSDNITVESNIEIEFITSDELMPNEMECEMTDEPIDYDSSEKNNESDFVDGISSQHDGGYDNDESWENVRLLK